MKGKRHLTIALLIAICILGGLISYGIYDAGVKDGVEKVVGQVLYPYDPNIEAKELQKERQYYLSTLNKILAEPNTTNTVRLENVIITSETANITIGKMETEIDSRIIILITMLEGGY